MVSMCCVGENAAAEDVKLGRVKIRVIGLPRVLLLETTSNTARSPWPIYTASKEQRSYGSCRKVTIIGRFQGGSSKCVWLYLAEGKRNGSHGNEATFAAVGTRIVEDKFLAEYGDHCYDLRGRGRECQPNVQSTAYKTVEVQRVQKYWCVQREKDLENIEIQRCRLQRHSGTTAQRERKRKRARARERETKREIDRQTGKSRVGA